MDFTQTREQQPADLFQSMIAKMVGEQMKKATGAPQGPYIHGGGGLFGVRGLSRGIISTHTQITGSLGEMIPIRASIDEQPLFPYITGFLRSDQQEKDGICDDPEEAGNFKTCIQTTVFGRKEFKTREVEINRIGQRLNRGEFMDLEVENSPLVNQMAGLMQGMFGGALSNQNALLGGREMMMRVLEVAVAFQRWLCPSVFTGNPSNSSAGGGYKEFPGLDLLIGTNKIDALSGVACPSLYSDVKSFGYKQVDTSVDPDIVKVITTIMRILNRRASQQNLGPADIRLVMREDLFYHLTEIWPCRYITYRCDNIAGGNVDPVGSFSVEGMYQMKVEMRNGQYLMVDGKRVPVIFDDCIPEENQADNGAIPIGGFASDIYFVPFSARGGTLRTLYWEYKDYRNSVIPDVNTARAGSFFWSDNGTFLWGVKPPVNWCLDLIAKIEPRLILRTPQLAGRLTDVVYVPLQHTDDVLPSQDYWVNGGNATGRPAPSPFSEWNPGGPGFNN